MNDFQSEIFLKNLSFIIAASVALICVALFYLKNSRISFIYKSIKKNKRMQALFKRGVPVKDSLDAKILKFDLIGITSVEKYSNKLDHVFFIWDISAFKINVKRCENSFPTMENYPWYEFSRTAHSCEEIVLPILKKIRSRYKGKFEHVNPIHVSRIENGRHLLFTWFKNEKHIHDVLFHFLDRILLLTQEANVYPSLSILWSDQIMFEVLLPAHPFFQNLKQKFDDVFTAEYEESEDKVKMRVWVAFSNFNVPNFLLEKVKKENQEKVLPIFKNKSKKAS